MDCPTGFRELPYLGVKHRDALEIAPRGVYRILDSEKHDRIYDYAHDAWREGPTVLLARIDDGKPLPVSVEEARFRADGKRLVIARVLDDEQAKGPFFEREAA